MKVASPRTRARYGLPCPVVALPLALPADSLTTGANFAHAARCAAVGNRGHVNLAGTMDRRDAIDILMRLHDAGHRYDPEALYTWSLAKRLERLGAERLRDFATRVNSGKRLRLGMPSALRSDIAQVWRERATTKPQ